MARAAGLSQATVSRVLRGDHTQVSPDNYVRTWTLAVQLGYCSREQAERALAQAAVPKERRESQLTIARALGISPSTVSNALLGRRGKCSPENYTRVWAHAIASGYRQTVEHGGAPLDIDLAQVGIVEAGGGASQTEAFGAALRWSIEEALAERAVIPVPLGTWRQPRERLMEKLWGGRGLKPAMMILGEVPAGFLAAARARTDHIVTVGATYAGEAASVVGHHAQAAELLVNHLHGLGHSQLVWLGGGEVGQALATKMTAVVTAAARRQLKLSTGQGLTSAEAPREAGIEGARALLHQPGGSPVTAVICSETAVARAAIEELARHGMRVPEDISVVALDAGEAPASGLPLLTSAATSPEALGQAAVELLTAGVFSGLTPDGHVQPTAEFVLGQTSAAARSVDRRLSAATVTEKRSA